ncbi:hypothetical protein AJ79_04788 [Helicocarpus griseus UAMH5409]|uniref:Ribosomal protein bL31m N-terminal domain-containing protein n=1 Tax=Helicocarpus griseus UAMH5409 TaxID=1447875 RepID=A0A2B7XSS0_9EURO|nr:hypothetical protein AJ79_04788 [Helicocarpus griseus UAMH5409]
MTTLTLPIRLSSITATTTSTTTSLTSSTARTTFICTQCRHATLLRRPKRPYTFTQLITLSDGSTFTHRTTSPLAVYRSTRDTRNAPLWNPSSEKLRNVEEDEAGRLAAFRSKFGRSWDAAGTAAAAAAAAGGEVKAKAEGAAVEGGAAAATTAETKKAEEEGAVEFEFEEDEEEDNLLDLISSFGQEGDNRGLAGEVKGKGKGKGKKK